MSKKKKTRKEKQISDLRKTKASSNSSSPTPNFSYDFIPPARTSAPVVQKSHETHNYGYVYRDVQKTLLITGVLLGINVGIYYLLQHNVITLPFMGW